MLEETIVYRLSEQTALPPGPTFQCSACGTRLRSGQPHSATRPWPHSTLAALVVWAPEQMEVR